MTCCGSSGQCQVSKQVPSLVSRAIQQYSAAMEAKGRDERIRGFALAEQLFRQLIEEQVEDEPSAALNINLGNAALQAEHVGSAILAYRRALAIDPSNSQAQQNLVYARMAVPEIFRLESTSGLIDTLFFWHAVYSRSQITGFASICFLVAAVMFASGLIWRQPLARNLALVPVIGWAICLFSVFLSGDLGSQDAAVVIVNELVLRSADSENSPPRLSEALTGGVEVRILRQRDRWTEIELLGGRSGWVLNSGFERL